MPFWATGHFLGADHTLAAMERDYYYPKLADRDDPRTWADKGATDLWSRSRAKAQQVLSTHYPDYISEFCR